MDEELRAEVAAIRRDLDNCIGLVQAMHELTQEFLPLIRAYLDPDQSGPRGFFMRRRLAETNGARNG